LHPKGGKKAVFFGGEEKLKPPQIEIAKTTTVSKKNLGAMEKHPKKGCVSGTKGAAPMAPPIIRKSKNGKKRGRFATKIEETSCELGKKPRVCTICSSPKKKTRKQWQRFAPVAKSRGIRNNPKKCRQGTTTAEAGLEGGKKGGPGEEH